MMGEEWGLIDEIVSFAYEELGKVTHDCTTLENRVRIARARQYLNLAIEYMPKTDVDEASP